MKKFIIMLTALLIVGCSNTVAPSHMAEAEVLCKQNGGVRSVLMGTLHFDVYCNNNAIFEDVTKVWPVKVTYKDGQAEL